MTVAPLLDQLHRDADAEVARRIDDARARATAFAADLESQLAQRRDRRLEEARRDLQSETERLRGAATQRANEITLAARERFVSRVIEAAMERAPRRAGDPAVAKWVSRNLDAALECFPPGPLVVRVAPSLAPALRARRRQLGDHADIREDPSLQLGVVVEARAGALGVDATLEGRLRAERPRLAIRLVLQAEGAAP